MMASGFASSVTIAGLLGSWLVIGASHEEKARFGPDAPDAVNEVIGDESFVATYGRRPTEHDPNLVRVRTHLAFVEHLLRSTDDSAMPAAARDARRRNLDLLRRYWQAELFPAGESDAGRQPTFIDDAGRRCAVAYLVEASAGTPAVDSINRRFRNAYIREIDDSALDAWIAGSGFTRREVMTIQPNYNRRWEWEHGKWEMERWQVVADASAFYLNRLPIAGVDPAATARIAGADAKLQLIDLGYHWLVGGEAAGGNTSSPGSFYKLAIRGGGVPISNFSDRQLTVLVTLGYQIDGIAGVVPKAAGIPFGLLVSFDSTAKRDVYDDAHEFVPWPVVQVRAEGEGILSGRTQAVAWTGSLDFVWRVNTWSGMTGDRFRPRDLIASLTVTEFAGTIYGGVALGLGLWSVTTQTREGHGLRGIGPPLGPYW